MRGGERDFTECSWSERVSLCPCSGGNVITTADGDQLELNLFPQLPWGGRSPRALTRIHKVLSLKPEAQGREVEMDPRQLDLFRLAEWPVQRKTRRRYGGAPTLLRLPSKKGRW